MANTLNMNLVKLVAYLVGFVYVLQFTSIMLGNESAVTRIPFRHLTNAFDLTQDSKDAFDVTQDYAQCIADGTPLILMVDNRVKVDYDPELETQNFIMLAATLNRMYALRHRYCFKIVKRDGPCPHETYGDRSPQWCKLLAIASALDDGFATIMYLDSDAHVNKMSISIPTFLAAMRNQAIPSLSDMGYYWTSQPDEDLDHNNQTDALVDNAALLVTADWETKPETNTGVMIFRNGDVARRMIRAWWDVDDHNLEWDFEQSAFRTQIYMKEEWARHIARLPMNTMNYNGWFVRHYAGDRPMERVPQMTKKIVATVMESILR